MSELDLLKLMQACGEETELGDFTPEELQDLLEQMQNSGEPMPLTPQAFKEKYFAYTDAEKNQITSKLKGKVKIKRSKGLGENAAEMMWETTMNPETRRLILVTPDEAERTQQIFELLLGENLVGRKEYIAEEGHRYLDMIDIS